MGRFDPKLMVASASIAPIVRLKFLFGLNDVANYLENLAPIMVWASAEINVGLVVANLPACRPVLDSFVQYTTSKTDLGDTTRGAGTSRTGNKSTNNYLELEERGSGLETSIYGKKADSESELELDNDSESQKGIVGYSNDGRMRVQIKRDIRVVSSPSEV